MDRINRIIWIFCRLTFQKKVNQTNLPSGGRKQSSLSPFAEQFLLMYPKLCDYPRGIIVCAGQFVGGDKPHPYPFGDTSFVVAGFIPAC
jgi:hypothetical protein